MATDDVLGYCTVDWLKCVEKPGDWAINNIFELQGAPDVKQNRKTLGFIYIQVKFLEAGMVDDQQEPLQVENLADMLAK